MLISAAELSAAAAATAAARPEVVGLTSACNEGFAPSADFELGLSFGFAAAVCDAGVCESAAVDDPADADAPVAVVGSAAAAAAAAAGIFAAGVAAADRAAGAAAELAEGAASAALAWCSPVAAAFGKLRSVTRTDEGGPCSCPGKLEWEASGSEFSALLVLLLVPTFGGSDCTWAAAVLPALGC